MTEALLKLEKAFIGGLLLDPHYTVPKVKSILLPSQLNHSGLGLIYKTILSNWDANIPVDLPTLNLKHPTLTDLLVECVEGVPTASNTAYYAQQIKESYLMRMVNTIGHNLSSAKDKNAVQQLRHQLEEITNQRVTSSDLSVLLEEFIADTQRNKEGFEITTGLGILDHLTMGYQRSSVYIIAGDTSHGKTALTLFGVLHNLERGVNVNYYTYDMSARRLVARLACLAGCISEPESPYPLKHLLYPMEYPREQDRIIAKTREVIKKYQVNDQLIVKGFVPLEEIEADMASRECGLVVIDFIQNAIYYANQGNKYENPEQMLTKYSLRFKYLAEKYKCPVLLLSQYAKPPDRKNKISRSSYDIKGASSIPQNADVVMLVEYVYKLTNDEEDKCKVIVTVEKNNLSATGVAPLRFTPELQTYSKLDDTTELKDFID